MPLTLDCVCSEAGRPICEVTAVTFVITEMSMPYGEFKLMGGPAGAFEGPFTVAGEYPLDLDWLPVLPTTAYVYFTATRSTVSDDLDKFYASFYVKVDFTCDDGGGVTSTQTGKMFNSEAVEDSCIDSGTFRAKASIAPGQFAGVIAHTIPLESCGGFTVQSGVFGPPFHSAQVVDVSADGDLCLCAQGGSSPYRYALTDGRLPSGVTLNGSTGCLEGAPNGRDPGTEEITFQVADNTSPIPNSATVTCIFMYCSGSGDEDFGNNLV